ncbi:hypothetical protein C900_01614 [Fulvivirga imtechensis AK7]|uniref:Uncharacterized protein n=1 Tax=Fulvivirga imtechensis AK7 TaxID=1237149 RepID=L8JYQ1_9BACT|nr:hypothetical protein [Fulvivirga imtechensis]ELR72332.1 hypothetical protein C900_01614 [Fulvivirga imtechensis AK7]
MAVKYSKHFLNKLEDLIAETDYILRYERGNFKSGWCILNDNKIIIVNKYFATDGKINCLLDIIKTVDINKSQLSEKNKKLYLELAQTELEL